MEGRRSHRACPGRVAESAA